MGEHGICKSLFSGWTDYDHLGGGEVAFISFLHYWALNHFVELARYLGHGEDVEQYSAIAEAVKSTCESQLWDGEWYISGFSLNGERIGSKDCEKQKIQLESNVWAVLSGVATGERAELCLRSIENYLYTDSGLLQNDCTAISGTQGIVEGMYPNMKEKGAIFSYSNPWAWMAEWKKGAGTRGKMYYDALTPYYYNEKANIRCSEPYSYSQYIVGKVHENSGEAQLTFMTGSAGWAYQAVTQYMIGVTPSYEGLLVNPCISSEWSNFSVIRRYRGGIYYIFVENPDGVQQGVKEIQVNGEKVSSIPLIPHGSACEVKITMG